ncbi:hypothetical protein G6F62_014471 [Rhizopus arrhizus]|nr:hypothetical protein G6F62_014471 [Rhizopus arrhizus]
MPAKQTLEVTLIMTPSPRSRRWGMRAWLTAMTPKVLVSNTARNVAAGVASTAENRPMPALLTSASLQPKAWMPSRMARAMLASSVTSSSTTRKRSDGANRAGSGRRMVAMTFHPCCRKWLAVAWP